MRNLNHEIIFTNHAMKRSNQRGIPKDLIAYTLKVGITSGDKYIVTRKIAEQEVKSLKSQILRFEALRKKFKQYAVAKLITKKLEELKNDLSSAKLLVEKAGLVVVIDGTHVITSYDYASHFHRSGY